MIELMEANLRDTYKKRSFNRLTSSSVANIAAVYDANFTVNGIVRIIDNQYILTLTLNHCTHVFPLFIPCAGGGATL